MMSGCVLTKFIDPESHRKLMPLAFAESFTRHDLKNIRYMVALYRANVLGGVDSEVEAAKSLQEFICGNGNEFPSLFSACNYKVPPEVLEFLLNFSKELGIDDVDIVFTRDGSTALNAELATLIDLSRMKYNNFVNEIALDRELKEAIRLSVARIVLLLQHGADPKKVKTDEKFVSPADITLVGSFVGKSAQEVMEILDRTLSEKGFCYKLAEIVLMGYTNAIIGTDITTSDKKRLIEYAELIIDTADDSKLLRFMVGLRDYEQKNKVLGLEVAVLRSTSVILHAINNYLGAVKDASEKMYGDVEIRNQAFIHHRKSVRVLARLLDHWKPDPKKVKSIMNAIIDRIKAKDEVGDYEVIGEIKILLNMGFLHTPQIIQFLSSHEKNILGDGADERSVKIIKSIVETCWDFDPKCFYGAIVVNPSKKFEEIVKAYGAAIDAKNSSIMSLCMAGSLEDFVRNINSGDDVIINEMVAFLKVNIISPEILEIINVINGEDSQLKIEAIKAFEIIKKKYSELPGVKQTLKERFSEVAYKYFMSGEQWNNEITTAVEFCNNEFLSDRLALLPKLRGALGEERYQDICNNIPQLLRNVNPCFESSRVNLVINSLLQAAKSCPDVDLEVIKHKITNNAFNIKHLRTPSLIFALEKTEVDPFYKFIRMSDGSHISIFEKLLIDKYDSNELGHRITLLEYLLGDDRAKEALKDKEVEEELFAFIGKILTSDDLEEKKKIEHSTKLFDAIFKLDHKLPAPNFDINGEEIDPMKMVIITAKTTMSVPFIAYVAKNYEDYPFSEDRVTEIKGLLEVNGCKDEALIKAICMVMSGKNLTLSNSKGEEIKIPGAKTLEDAKRMFAGLTKQIAGANAIEVDQQPKKSLMTHVEEHRRVNAAETELSNAKSDIDSIRERITTLNTKLSDFQAKQLEAEENERIARQKAEEERKREAEERKAQEKAAAEEIKRRAEKLAKIRATREEAKNRRKKVETRGDFHAKVVGRDDGIGEEWKTAGERSQKPTTADASPILDPNDFPELLSAKTPPPAAPTPPPAPPQIVTPPQSREPRQSEENVEGIRVAFGDFDPVTITTPPTADSVRRELGELREEMAAMRQTMQDQINFLATELNKFRRGAHAPQYQPQYRPQPPRFVFHQESDGSIYATSLDGSNREFYINPENGEWNQVIKEDDGYYYFVNPDGSSSKAQYDAQNSAPAPSAENPDGAKIVEIDETQHRR